MIIFLVKVVILGYRDILGYMGILRIVGQSQAKTYNLAAAITNLRGNCKPQATWILWLILGAAPPKSPYKFASEWVFDGICRCEFDPNSGNPPCETDG